MNAAELGREILVEVVSRDGARLTMRGKTPHSEVAALIRAFRCQP